MNPYPCQYDVYIMDDDSDWEEPTWSGEMDKVDDRLPCSFYLMQAIQNDVKHNQPEQMIQRLLALNPVQLDVFLQDYREWIHTQTEEKDTVSEVEDEVDEDE
jgi:hypothetical protein